MPTRLEYLSFLEHVWPLSAFLNIFMVPLCSEMPPGSPFTVRNPNLLSRHISCLSSSLKPFIFLICTSLNFKKYILFEKHNSSYYSYLCTCLLDYIVCCLRAKIVFYSSFSLMCLAHYPANSIYTTDIC